MLLTGKDDLRNRIPPRLRDFAVNKKDDTDPKMRGVVNWYKAYMEKTYCQETNGYTCQRQAATMKNLGDGGTGKRILQLKPNFHSFQIKKNVVML